MTWRIAPQWADNRNDIFPGEMFVRILMGMDEKGVIHILEVEREKVWPTQTA